MKRTFLFLIVFFALMAISAVAQEAEAVVAETDTFFFRYSEKYNLESGGGLTPDGGWGVFDQLIAESGDYDLVFVGQADLKTEAYDNLAKPTDLRLDPKGLLLQNMGQEFIARQRAMVARDRVGRGQVLGRVVDSPDDRGLKVFRTPRELSGRMAELAEAASDSSAKEEALPDTTQKVAEADSTEAEDTKTGTGDGGFIGMVANRISLSAGHQFSRYGFNGPVGKISIALFGDPEVKGFSFSVWGLMGRTSLLKDYSETKRFGLELRYQKTPNLGVSINGGYHLWGDYYNDPQIEKKYNKYSRQFEGWQTGASLYLWSIEVSYFWSQGRFDDRKGPLINCPWTINDYKTDGILITLDPIKTLNFIF